VLPKEEYAYSTYVQQLYSTGAHTVWPIRTAVRTHMILYEYTAVQLYGFKAAVRIL
jgi:hypothetical protein